MDTKLLENNRIKLRALEPEDLEILYQWENDVDMWKYSNAISPYSKILLREYINDSLQINPIQSKQLRLIIEHKADRKAIGTIDLFDIDIHNSRSSIGILIDENYRKNNFASDALILIHQYVFNYLNLHQLYAYVGVRNEASISLFSKLNYQKIGVLADWILTLDGKYEDVTIFQLINSRQND